MTVATESGIILNQNTSNGLTVNTLQQDGKQSEIVVLAGLRDGGSIKTVPVTAEGHLEVAVHSPRLPFGELSVASLEPVFQSDAVYGINTYEQITSTDGTSGTATAASNLFSVGTGATTAGRYGSIQSRKRLRYRPGQGVVSRFTMLFGTPQTNNIQVVGVGTSESTLAFGYNGTAFGILHSTDGVRCINTLTVSAGSSAEVNATVTLNDVAFTVAVTIGNATQTAYEISKGTYAGWTAVQRGATVIFLANEVGVKAGAYTLSFESGTGAGTFPGSPTLAGVAASNTWIAQADWNEDVCDGTGSDSNPSGFNLNPLFGNVGQIDIQYLGFGSIVFKIEASNAGNNPDFINVHTLRIPNSQITTSMSQPSFPFLMSTYNTGTAGGTVTTKCGSFAGFIAGKKKLAGPRMSYFNTTAVTSATSSYTPIFTVRNDITYASRANQSIINLLSIGGATKGNANSVTSFYLIRNATLTAGAPNFTAYATTSCSYVDVGATTCTFATNDQVVWTGTVTQDGNFTFSFTDEITLQPGETATLAVRSVTATAVCVGQLNTREDQ